MRVGKGRRGGRVAHAAVEATLRADKRAVAAWRDEGMGKIVLKVPGEPDLLRLLQLAKDAGLPTALITDAGRTAVAPGTRTCLGAGPAKDEDLDRIFGQLPLA